MFGCMIANQSLLSDAQKARYKGCYCGLCRVLKERHGLFGRVTLTYDMTFLLLVLTSMLEPEEQRGTERCAAHPLRKHFYWQSDLTVYAADMNVALAYHNCRDDFLDDGSAIGFWEAETLQASYEIICSLWPRQCAAIERELAALQALERENRQEPDAAAACFGRLLGELFVMDDPFTERLRPFGEALGRTIYLMDAVMDLDADRRSGAYNPLIAMADAGWSEEAQKALLTAQLGACCDAFERLPLLEDVELMRNILYSGIWQRYEAAMHKKHKREGAQPREGSL